MPVIKKFAENLSQNLTSFGVFEVDTNPNSKYFKITEFKDTFTGGKNGFLIEGSEHLKESTEVKIQILDVEGNSIYYEPGNGIPEYYEGTSKLIAVYIYDDTPIGTAKITILGELKTFIDESGVTLPIPDDWKDVYNVKWEKTFQINKLLSNEDKVRFYRRPVVNIDEIVKPIFNNVTTTIIQTGSLNGIAQSPIAGQKITDVTIPTSYLLKINDSTNWTGSVIGTTISIPNLNYSPLVDSVINNKNVLVLKPHTDSNGLVQNFINEGYTASFNYIEGANNLKTALTGSFAKINLSDITTFVGDCARVKIFRKSQSDLADYQFIQEIRLESNELLRDLESTIKNEEFYGIFDNTNFKNYWVTSSNNLTTSFNQNYLFNSIKLDSSGINNFYTSKSLDITEDTEYSLNFNVRIGSNQVLAGNYINVFLSGSRQSSINGSPTTIQINQNISTITADSSLLQKNQLSANFKAEQINNAKLYFEIKGNGWHLADVSLRASQETSYSPDSITFIQSVPRSLPEETFLYRFEFYDINNNFIPVLVEANKTFNGGNLQTIQKGLVFTPRSLQFQFDSGSNPVPPTVVGFTVTKNLLTGSVTYTSQSFDFDGTELFGNDYTSSITVGGGFPGLLDGITSDAPTMTVQHFTGSRTDKIVQLVKITGEAEGFTDTVIFTRVLDGFGGVNFVIRPYRGTQIRNSSTSSLEIQAIRIDGVNDIELSSLTKPEKGFPDTQLHIISRSFEGNEKFVNLAYASSSGLVIGLTSGSLGSGQINYNAIFNRDSIDVRRTIFMMSSASAASGPAFQTSGSILATIILEDLQDGLDTPFVLFNADTFNIDPRNESIFRPQSAIATASFFERGGTNAITASFRVFPSMSINQNWIPEYWFYFTTQSVHPDISVIAIDENQRTIAAGALNSSVRSPLSQSKNITIKFTYTEPYSSPSLDTASISVDKTFTIVPQGTPGDETIIFEVNPSTITLAANSRGVVNDFKPSITDIRLKQGARYLVFSSSAAYDPFYSHGQFYIASSSIIERNVKAGNIHFTSSFGTQYTASLIVSQSSNFTNLSGSITYPLVIHPYFTSSIYTASVVVNYTKVLDGPPPIQIVISPTSVSIPADEVGFVSSHTNANTTIRVKEGDDFLTFTTQSTAAGTFRINLIETKAVELGSAGPYYIRTGSLSSSSLSTATINFNRFDYPHVSASAIYTIQVFPFALGAGHEYTSSIFERTQTFTKNVSVPNARTVELNANPYTINYNRDGYKVAPDGDVELKALAQNYTGSTWFTLFYIDTDGSETLYDGPYYEGVPYYTFIVPATDAAGPGENKTWRVKLTDGNPYTSSIYNPYRAEAQLTIAGIKAGADAFKVSADNLNTSITADLFTTNFEGTAIKLPTFKGVNQLQNVITAAYPSPQATDYDYLNNLIGILGFSSASIFSKSPYITLSSNKILTNPASLSNITGWQKPAINKSGEVVYKIEFEGYSTNLGTAPPTRYTEFVTQSFAVQFTEPAPYDVKLTRENAAAVYKVSGEMTLANTSTQIFANRGTLALTNKPAGFTSPQTDAYGSSSYEQQYRVQISAVSGHLTLSGGLTAGSYLPGTPTATMAGVTGWNTPETNRTAIIVYQIICEDRQSIYKTQSLSVQFEGETGPGIVMRGEWDPTLDYIGGVETTNNRRDAVTYLATQDDVKYYAAISGSGPTTYDQNGVLVNYHAPTPSGDNDWWEFLGSQDFFVSAKLAIFEESYVRNTINVGTYNNTSKYANIVLAGGRSDPYISLGQHGTVGTGGTSGTSINPSTSGAAGTSGTGVIGYDRPGIFLGLYEQGAAGTYGRLSIKDYSGDNYMKWDGEALILSGLLNAGGMKLGRGVNGANNGLYLNANNYWYDTGTNFKVGGSSNYLEWDGTTLTLRGSLKQTPGGVNEGRIMGPWASGTIYYTNDIVTYSGNTWTANSDHTSTNNTSAATGYPGFGPWTIAPISAKLLRLEASSQVFIEAQNGTLSPDWIELTSNKQNISATTNWTTSPSVTLYDASSGGSVATTGNTVFLRKADFGVNTLVEITATADSITDTVTIARVQEGTDALTIFLTNESHTLPASSAGVVSDYNGSGTNIFIYEGAIQLDYDGAGTAAGKFTVSTAVSNITAGSITDGGNYAIVGNHSNMTANLASVTYTLTGKKLNGDSFSIAKVQSLTKSIAGAAGATGAAGAGVVYRGRWTVGRTYTKTSTRVDVVQGADGAYYLAKSTHTAGAGQDPTGGAGITGTPATYWESFGATFSSVATDVLFAQDVYANRTVNVGSSGSVAVIQLNADSANSGSNPFISVGQSYTGSSGFDQYGIFLGLLSGSAKMSLKNTAGDNFMKWTGNSLEIQGSVNITDGRIGGGIGSEVWQVDGGLLYASASVGQIKLNADRPAIEIYDSASNLRVDINPNGQLSTTVAITTPISASASPNIVQENYATAESANNSSNSPFVVFFDTNPMVSSSASPNSASFYVPSSAEGLAAIITVTTSGNSFTSADVVGSGTISSGQMTQTYGVRVFAVPQTYIGPEETIATKIAYATKTQSFGYLAQVDMEVNLTNTFVIPVTLKGGYFYRIQTFSSYLEAQYDFLPDIDVLPPPYIDGQVYNDANWGGGDGQSPKSPVLNTVSVNIAQSKTELIAGGMQIVYDNTRFVKMPRAESGAVLIVSGGLDVGGTITNFPGYVTSSNYYAVPPGGFFNGVFSHGANTGYSKLVNGLILQAGYVSTAGNSAANVTVTFPLAFPTKCLAVTCATDRNSDGSRGFNHVYDVTAANAKLVLDAGGDGYWIAVGY